MEYNIYLGYKVYKNGNVENNKGVILKPQLKNGFSFYIINNRRFSCGAIVLLAFKIYPSKTMKIKRKDGNPLNNSLENLSW